MSDLDDPEDAFDIGDPIPVRLDNLDARLRYVIDRGLFAGELVDRLGRVRGDLREIRRELEP